MSSPTAAQDPEPIISISTQDLEVVDPENSPENSLSPQVLPLNWIVQLHPFALPICSPRIHPHQRWRNIYLSLLLPGLLLICMCRQHLCPLLKPTVTLAICSSSCAVVVLIPCLRSTAPLCMPRFTRQCVCGQLCTCPAVCLRAAVHLPGSCALARQLCTCPAAVHLPGSCALARQLSHVADRL